MEIKNLFNLPSTILLTGETGTGKSRLAKKIHNESPWKDRPFLTLHLSSLSEELLESELFGHVKGSFTGATQDKKGYLEEVANGTLFLDEIGELSLEGQKKLLYALEEKHFVPVGSCHEKEFKGRIIAATNKNLEELVREKKFREDLFFRLRIFTYHLPSLRDNPKEISKLAHEFLPSKKSFSKEALDLLERYPWPGNIRELKHALEYASYMGSEILHAKDFPSWMTEKKEIIGEYFPLDYAQALEAFENKYFQYIAHYFDGRVNQAAREVNISKSTLISKYRKYGVNIWRIKAEKVEEELKAVA